MKVTPPLPAGGGRNGEDAGQLPTQARTVLTCLMLAAPAGRRGEEEEEGGVEDAGADEAGQETYLRRLAREAKQMAGGAGDGNADESDDEWTDDEEVRRVQQEVAEVWLNCSRRVAGV